MKAKLILSLALALGVILSGCSSTSPQTQAKVFDKAGAGSSFMDDAVLMGLGNGFSIRLAANSRPALIQKAEPALAWNGRDMLWIERDTHGQPQFVLDKA